jgi:hypothetical protein
MNRFDRREASVRQLLEGAPAAVPPPGLYGESVRVGRRLLHRRRVVRRLLWLLLCAAILAFSVWAVSARPWIQPPSDTTPTITGW